MSCVPDVYAYSAVMMGSPILLKLFQHNESLAREVFRLIRQQENLLTVNQAHSEVMAVNHAAGRHPVAVSLPVYALIKRAHEVSLRPDSAFNFAIGPLVKRWKIGFNGSSVPDVCEVQDLLALTDPHQVRLDDATRTVFLPQAGMEIDLGAIAKGYIADRVRDYLLSQQVDSGLINLGGNVQTLAHPTEEGWGIGLQQPFGTPDKLTGVIHVSRRSVVTSGVYERYFELDGRHYHHILDPRTGYPLDNALLSVTVISADSIDGDIWTTLLYGLGVEKSLSILREMPQIEAIFVTRDGQAICSSRRHFRFTLLDPTCTLIDAAA